ncbi:DUF305 domain-containing protein [Plantactinospora sp. GCM10030261]|uniref:DUF305 domain-containing protein n=1 Tax=Plantactinospora sp. GCM10030261 TaxID=3273420 RepID=UPI0036190475
MREAWDGTAIARMRRVALAELAVLGVLAAGALVADVRSGAAGAGGSKPAGAASAPESIALPGVPGATAPVLLPGRPGEAAKTARADEVSPLPTPPYNAADIRFVTMMIPHHEQALLMAGLVPDRSQSPGLRAIADRIVAGQRPEIKMLEEWLAVRGLSRDSGGAQAHRHMAGMQSAAALDDLAAARGTDFDRRFVDMMTAHHRGAIEMARQAQGLGADGTVNELATSVAAEQAAEIERLRGALTTS